MGESDCDGVVNAQLLSIANFFSAGKYFQSELDEKLDQFGIKILTAIGTPPASCYYEFIAKGDTRLDRTAEIQVYTNLSDADLKKRLSTGVKEEMLSLVPLVVQAFEELDKKSLLDRNAKKYLLCFFPDPKY